MKNLQDLKERVIENMKFYYIENTSCTEKIRQIFSEFECSSKDQETELEITEDEIRKRTGYEGDITMINFCKEIQELGAYRIKYGKIMDEMHEEINKLRNDTIELKNKDIDSMKADIDQLKEVVKYVGSKKDEKQERFYYKANNIGDCFILDRNKKIALTEIYTLNESFEICKALNAMEAGAR